MIECNNADKLVIITAGGTGGHIFPALSIANTLMDNGYKILWIGATYGLENDIVKKHNINIKNIDMVSLRNKGLFRAFKVIHLLVKSIYQTIRILKTNKPQVVIGFGGYVSFPVILAARLLNIPTVIHEQNAIAGLSNKILSKIVNVVCVAYGNVLKSNKTIITGNPIRQEFINNTHTKTQTTTHNPQQNTIDSVDDNAKHKLNILIVGGSLGAGVFNNNIPKLINKLTNIAQIVHQTGKDKLDFVKNNYLSNYLHNSHENKELTNNILINDINVTIIEFIDDILSQYKQADLLICRSGAITVAEVSAIGIATIFIPYPYAVDNHQFYNVKHLSDNKLAIVIEEKNLDIDILAKIINNLSYDECKNMACRLREFSAHQNTNITILNIINKLLAK